MAGPTGYPRLMAAGDSANDAFLDAITAAVDTLDTYVARVNAGAVISAGDNTTFKIQGLNGPAVAGATRTVRLLGRVGSEDHTFLDALNAIADTFGVYRTRVNASAAITGGDTTCYKVQDVNGAAVSGATVFYRSTSRFDTDLDDLETQINGMVEAMGQFVSAWNLKQGGTPTTLVVCTVKRLRPFTRPADGVEDTTRNIAIDGGDSQSATVATQPSTALTVVVTDGTGSAVEGEQVTWGTTTSDGEITATSLTNASGIASATPILGTLAGSQSFTAATSTGQSVSFTLTATAGAAANITAASTQDQSALTSTNVATPPSALITDAHGNPKSGTTVTFAVTAGGGSRNPASVISGSDGLSTLTNWTLGAGAGLNTLTATAAGLTGSPVTFNANGVAAAPTQIAVQSGGAQTGVVAGQAATATVFRVRDAGSNPVQGVTVAFTVTSGSGSLSVASAATDANGDASVTYTTHTTVETATIKGAFTNASGAEVSISTTIASTFGVKDKLAIQTQPSSNGDSGVALSQQPVILIQDVNGNTVTNATDTITAAVQTGNAVLSAGSTKVAASGVASFTGMILTDSDGGANTLRFSSGALTVVDSSSVTLAPPVPVALQFSGPISSVVEDSGVLTFNVLVVDSNNVVVPGAANAVTVALTTPGGATLSGDVSVNATAGMASWTVAEALTVDTVGTYTLTATATGLTPAVSGSFSVTAATGTNEPVGYTRFAEWDCSVLPTTTRSTTGMTDGAWQCERNGNQSILSGSKYQIRFSATLAAGTDPGNLRVSHDTGVNDPTDAFYMRLEGFRPGRSTADGGDDAYQNHQVDTKICHFKCFALGGGTGAAILRLLGQSPGNSLMQTFRVDVLSKQANIAYTQNVDATRRVTAGQDNTIEVQCVMNSSAGAADGIIKIWVNGVLVASHSNVVFKTASSGNVGFYDWWFEHTYGGTAGGAPPSGTRTRVDYWTFDNIYMSQP